MKKIPTLFVRDFDVNPKHVLDQVNPECDWVIDGQGKATFKWDGTCAMIRDGKLWKRRELKKDQTQPTNFVCEQVDEKTGKQFGWLPCDRNESSDKYHFQAFDQKQDWSDGTYELIGPKSQGNPHSFSEHTLIAHGERDVEAPRTFEKLAKWLHEVDEDGFEGIVWWHPDGRKAKIKAKDFPQT